MTRATRSRGYRRGKAGATRKRIFAVVGAVIALSLIVWLSSALSSPDDVDTSVDVAGLTSVERSQSLFDDALVALDSGDTTSAAELLREAVALDPDNSAAAAELKKVTENDDPADDPADDPTDDPVDDPADDPVEDLDEGFSEPVADMRTLLPTTLTGFTAGMADASDTDVAMSYDPTFDGPTDQVSRALLSVHDRGSAADAERFVNDVSKVTYSKNADTVTVDGVEAYFGTDGSLLATVAFTRGRFAFEVVVTAEAGAPSALKDIAAAIAAAFPDTF